MLYCIVAWLARGDNQWWYIDFVAGGNVYWGDDAYRYFLAKTAWTNPDIYWFNFVLPVAISLDGLITTFADGHLFLARALKSAPLVASIFFVYFSCIRLGVPKRWALAGAAALALTPLYVLVSLSFYGESWLVFFISLVLYLIASGRFLSAAIAIGLMPLVRIESIGFVGAFAVMSLLRRDWRLIFTVFAPGFLYFLLVVIWGPGISGFLGWRFEMAKVYDAVGIWYGGNLSQIIDVLYWPWLLAASIGLFLKSARPIWPATVGTGLIILHLCASIILKTGSFEPRFLMASFPLMAVGLAVLLAKQESLWRGEKSLPFFQWTAGCFLILLLSSHALSVNVFNELKDYIFAHGKLPLAVKQHPYSLETYFKRANPEKVAGYKEYADVAMRMMEENPKVKTFVVSDSNVLYFLNPHRIPSNVNVVFPLFGWPTLESVIEGPVTSGYFPHAPFAGYFSLEYPSDKDGLLLYLDDMKIDGYPYHWEVSGNHIYLFSAKAMLPANVKIKSR